MQWKIYLAAWFPMLIIAIINGSIRDFVYKKPLGALRAHQVSTFSLILFFTVYLYALLGKYPFRSGREALLTGFIWMLMTLVFEFGFGRWRGKSWSELLADYQILEERLWILIPVFLCIGPYLLYRFKLS